MACNDNTNLEGLRKPSKFKAFPNAREELYTIAYDIVKDKIDRLTNLGWSQDKLGNRKQANHYYKGANRYLYIVQLAIYVRNYIDSISKLRIPCNSAEAAEKYKLDCVESNFNCMSSEFGTDYKSAWFQILQEFGINRSFDNCEECCEGVGGMVVNDDSCTSLIVGNNCDEIVDDFVEVEPLTLSYTFSEATEINIPITRTSTIIVDWGDGSTSTYSSGGSDISHNYSSSGIYQISILGDVTQLNFDREDSAINLTSVDSLGENSISYLSFEDCENLTSFTAGNHSTGDDIIDMSYCFENCFVLEHCDLGNIDLRNVTNATRLFFKNYALTNIDTYKFNTSSLISADYMFYDCGIKSIDLSHFSFKSLESCRYMFSESGIQYLEINELDTPNLIDCSYMFQYCNSLETVKLHNWIAPNLNNAFSMFRSCETLKYLNINNIQLDTVENFNQVFEKDSKLKDVKIENVSFSKDSLIPTTLEYVFRDCLSIVELDISSWDFSGVTSIVSFFDNCESLKSINLEGLDLSNVEDAYGFAIYCESLEYVYLNDCQFVSNNGVELESMFYNCENLKGVDFTNTNFNNVTTLRYMFNGCKNLTSLIEINSLDVSNVIDFEGMFTICESLEECDISNWNMSSATIVEDMYQNSPLIISPAPEWWNLSNIINYEDCFVGNTLRSNYEDIPEDWK